MVKTKSTSVRQQEIVTTYQLLLRNHLQDLRHGRANTTYEVGDLADQMHMHPVHLSNTIKEVTGKSPCYFYEHGLMEISKDMILNTKLSIAAIARHLMYDPSNFNKFFKSYAGVTPHQFRLAAQESEVLTTTGSEV